jgi:adsorption protein B
LVLFVAYVLLILAGALWLAGWFGARIPWQPGGSLAAILWANLASVIWRSAMRFAFTAREYGWAEGLRAVVRLPHANVIAIMAARRALVAYVASLFGVRPSWEKTVHDAHPVEMASMEEAA